LLPVSADFLTGKGAGTSGDLRYCIAQADTTAGADEIVFALPANSTIKLAQMMQPITDPAGLSIRGDTAANLATSGDANNSGTNEPGDVRVFFVMNGARQRGPLAGPGAGPEVSFPGSSFPGS
jgi:hypothetical protein